MNKKDKLKTINYYIEREKRRKKALRLLLFVLTAIIILVSIYSVIYNIDKNKKQKENNIKLQQEEKEKRTQQRILKDIKNSYNSFVVTTNDAKIYKLVNGEYVEAGTISNGVELNLKSKDIKDYKDVYFELQNIAYFIKYTDVKVIDSLSTDQRYKKYIPFNENVVSSCSTFLYDDRGRKYTINEGLSLPILIKDGNRYYVDYDNKLLYLEKSDSVSIEASINTSVKPASKISVIAYHYTYDSSAGEKCLSTIICHDVSQIKSQFNYLNENEYYTTTLKELELFLNGKIRLPVKSVTVTVDDGWWFDRMYTLANEYKVNVTLFFIGNLQNNADILAYSRSSNYVQFASHTYNLHNTGVCSGGQGSPLKCSDKDKVLADLKKSREQLNNTTYFAWPFYEYNDYAISLIKQAGFTMAFAGGMYKAYPGVNMYTVPRYTVQYNTTLDEFASYITN